MWKALLKKQLMEVNSWLFQNKKTGKNRNAAQIAGMIVIYAALFLVISVIFVACSVVLCQPLTDAKMDWLYLDIMGLLALMLGVFGSVFNTYSTLYNAKDNEFLLSMPIPIRRLLAVRLLGVWMWSFIYVAIVYIPALVIYWITISQNGALNFGVIFSGIVLMLLLSVFVLTLSCALGWIVAKVSVKLKHKSAVTVFLSLIFLAAYYFCYSQAYQVLQTIALNAASLGNQIRGAAYPLYIAGCSGTGDMLSLFMVAAIVILLFLFVCRIMSRSFIKISTTKNSASKKKHRAVSGRAKSVENALLFKELKRFTSSANYMLNCGLGTVLLPAAGVFLLIEGDFAASAFSGLASAGGLIALLVCAVSSMNDITAPSVSLEGNNIWLLQSLPVAPWQALKAKLRLHILITEPAVLFCSVCAVIVFKPQPLEIVLMIVLPALFVVLSASFGLIVNLKSPNLKWKDETIAVKQSVSVMLCIFGGWGFVILLGVLYFALCTFLPTAFSLSVCTVLVLVLTVLELMWLKKKGSVILSSLQ